jgi:hypothetical protein
MMLIIQECCFIQSLHFSYELLEDSVQNSKCVDQFPCIRSDDVDFCPDAHLSSIICSDDVDFCPDAHLSSIICSDDENILSGRSFVSRTFKQSQIASVQTSQQHVRMPFNVQQVKRFLSKARIWEDSCNNPDDVVFPSIRYAW